MRKRETNKNAPFQTIDRAAEMTGIPRGYIRTGCQRGTIPHIRSGRVFLVNVPGLLRLFDEQSDGNSKEGVEE